MASESLTQQQTRQLMFELGGQCWRNNSGAGTLVDEYGKQRQVRWGLANDSAAMNKNIKSSDLIGITPTLITQEMVGYYLGVFTALEIKHPGWHLTPGDKRGQAQAKFHQLVKDACGFAGFVTDPQDALRIVRRA